jgi:hypothetical protein
MRDDYLVYNQHYSCLKRGHITVVLRYLLRIDDP